MAMSYKTPDHEKDITTYGMREARLQPETETIVNDMVTEVSSLEQVRGEGLYTQSSSDWDGPVSQTMVNLLLSEPDGHVVTGIDHRHGKQVSVLLKYMPQYRSIQACYMAFGRPTGSFCKVAYEVKNRKGVWAYDRKFNDLLMDLATGSHKFQQGEHENEPFVVNDPQDLWAVKVHQFFEV